MLPQSVSIRDFYQSNDTKEYQRFVLFARPKWMIRWMNRWCVSPPGFLLSFALTLSITHPCSQQRPRQTCFKLTGRVPCLNQSVKPPLTSRHPPFNSRNTSACGRATDEEKKWNISSLSPWCFCQRNHAMKTYQRNFSCFLQLSLTNQSSCHLPF